jgi:hypothetical protein
MFGYETAEKKKSEKGLIANWSASNFYRRKLCWNTPVYHGWINENGDKGRLWEQGAELGGGGEGQIRGAKG